VRTFLYWLVRLALRPLLAPWNPVAGQRAAAAIAGLTAQGPPGAKYESLALGGVPARRITPARVRPGCAVLYLHGGAYVIGGPASHAKLAAQIAHAAQVPAWFVDYRLAPEHPFPAALEDAMAAYRALLAQNPGRIVLAGDSAGGGLALALALSVRDQKLPAPDAVVLLSPWADLTLGGESHRTHAARDPMLRTSWLATSAARYAAGRSLSDPLLSPALGDLSGLPRMLIQVGSEEILLSDAERVAQLTGATLRRYEGLWHDFQAHAGLLPEADRALEEIGAFVGAARA
jgi:monoterpene epsilon-lactone hydrolase